jgi:hypothetical protein
VSFFLSMKIKKGQRKYEVDKTLGIGKINQTKGLKDLTQKSQSPISLCI